MSKRLLITAAALAALWAAPADCRASAFGLTYSRQCSACGFCVRPYNAFSSVTCGVANVNYGGGCCPGFAGLNPRCCGYGGYGGYGPNCGLLGWRKGCWDGCGGQGFCGRKVFGKRMRGRLFGMKNCPVFPEEYYDSGAFGSEGDQVAFFGQPAITGGYNPGCHMAWAWNTPPVNVPGHTPPGVFVQPPNNSCCITWLPPRPSPGMYGIAPYGYPPMPYYGPPEAMKQPMAAPAQSGTVPASYQQPQGGQGYYPAAGWWYPGYGYGMQPQWGYYGQGYYGQ
jgi:hypothetical protein